jgi:thymidylate synthase (FAD)
MIIIEQSANLLSHTPEPEILLERAGRVCYKSEEKITPTSAAKFVEMICQRNHESVLEHASATMLFTTDRGVAQELTRHRIGAYSMESTRYVNYHKKGELRFVEPMGLADYPRSVWVRAMEHAESAYNEMIEHGCKPEQARDVLPLDLACDIVVTYNFRQWKWVIKQRTAPAAHPKIQALIRMAFYQLHLISPTVFQ